MGNHLEILLKLGHENIVYDNLEAQVHADLYKTPNYLAKNIEFIQKDIRDMIALSNALRDTFFYH